MALAAGFIRLVRISPVLCSSMVLMFSLDEHLTFGTWVSPAMRPLANPTLPAWWTRGGCRWRWVLIVFYPVIYILGILNLLIRADQPVSTTWYQWGLFFSLAIIFFVPMALRRIADIESGAPKGNVVSSMEAWLRMNRVRALITDLPAWLCFIIAALKALLMDDHNDQEGRGGGGGGGGGGEGAMQRIYGMPSLIWP